MTVGLIGNMNNNFFAFARYLRDAGYQVKLILLNEPDHFRPIADTYNFDYQAYTTDSRWHMHSIESDVLKSLVSNDTDDLDFIFGCDYAPAYLQVIGRSLDCFLPFGSDFYEFPFLDNEKLHFSLKLKRWIIYRMNAGCKCGTDYELLTKARYQREGILNTKKIGVFSITTSPQLQEFIKVHNLSNKFFNLPIPMLYFPQYENSETLKRTPFFPIFQQIRDKYEILIFHQTKHDYSLKGNDILLRGLAKFVKKTRFMGIGLITMEYGMDVGKSKAMIDDLGIQDNVVWLPKMFRRDLMAGLSIADIGACQFANSFITNGSLFETMATGKPVMQYREDEKHDGIFENLYPVMNVKTEEDICNALIDYKNNRSSYEEMGVKTKEWFMDNIIHRSIREYTAMINGVDKIV